MTDKKKCPKCGSELHSGAQFCMYCMYSMQPKTDVTPNVPRRRGILLWIVLFAAVILLIVMLLLGKSMISLFGNMGEKIGLQQQSHSDELHESPVLADSTLEQGNPDPNETSEGDKKKSPSDMSAKPTEPPALETIQRDPKPSVEGQESSEDETTEPEATEPAESLPDETPPDETVPAACEHYYLEATCSEPMTCTQCGDTWGEADETAHKWTPETVTVHHDEVGHYEEEEDYFQKTVYLCFFCGYDQEGYDSLDEVREHITVHSDCADYGLVTSRPDLLADTREIWDTRTVQVWVVDQEAYDETIVKCYTCSICGEEKAA